MIADVMMAAITAKIMLDAQAGRVVGVGGRYGG